MRKYRNKILILLSCLCFALGCFIVPSFAYEEDSNGNLVSENLINYKEITSDKFTDLNNDSFILNWGGGVSTVTLPYYTFESTTQYSLTITNLSGATYWAYQFYWNYSDNTSERFTNNQGVGNGTYSFSSDSSKTLSSITIVLNYEATFKDLMLNVGTPLQYEKYGAIYYSQSNYNEAYNNGVNSVFDGLRDFNAIQGYYASSILFRSTDNGNTFINLNSLGIVEQNVIDGNLQVLLSSGNTWAYGDNVVYYIDIDFANPVYFANLYLPSLQRPNPQYVRVNDVNYDFNYTMIDGMGYFVTRNIYSISNNLRFYFKAYEGMPLSFDIIIKGFNNAVDSYQTGYNDGVEAMERQVDLMEENIEALERKVNQLNEFIESGSNSWQALFFSMADTPLKTISNMLGFELFGLNVFQALIGIITTLAILFVIKRLIK